MLVIAIRDEVLLHVAHDQLKVVLVHVEYLEVVVALATAVGAGVDQLGQLHAPFENRLPLAPNHVPIIPVDHDEVDVRIHDDGDACVDSCLTPGKGGWQHVSGWGTRRRGALNGIHIVAIGAESKRQHHPERLLFLLVVVAVCVDYVLSRWTVCNRFFLPIALPLPTPQCLMDQGTHQRELGDALLLGQLLFQVGVYPSGAVLVARPRLKGAAVLEGSDFIGKLKRCKKFINQSSFMGYIIIFIYGRLTKFQL